MHKVVKMAEAVPGMVLARCVVDSNGKIVLSDGVVLTENIIRRLVTWGIGELYIVDNQAE